MKKKSLLGIGYLSVAMLSASLLMTNPVSADVEVPQDAIPQVADENTDSKAYLDGFRAGYPIGHEAGVKGIDFEDPHPQSTETSDQNQYEDGYYDGYEAGYKNATEKVTLELKGSEAIDTTIPSEDQSSITQFFSEIWHWIVSWFTTSN